VLWRLYKPSVQEALGSNDAFSKHDSHVYVLCTEDRNIPAMDHRSYDVIGNDTSICLATNFSICCSISCIRYGFVVSSYHQSASLIQFKPRLSCQSEDAQSYAAQREGQERKWKTKEQDSPSQRPSTQQSDPSSH
jgi:hypothetical protein